MAPARTPPAGDTDQAMILGELRGQVRELIHATNNTAQKLEAIGMIATTQAALVKTSEDHERRIKGLEETDLKRQGAIGLVEWLSKHWPFSLIVAALAAWVAWANGRL